MLDLGEAARAFEGSDLEGREVTAVPVADTAEVGFEVDIEGIGPLAAWQLARPVCAALGVWPFVPQYEGQNVYSRYFYDEVQDGRDQSPAAIIARAEALQWPVDEGRLDATVYFARDWPSVIRVEREATARRLGRRLPRTSCLAPVLIRTTSRWSIICSAGRWRAARQHAKSWRGCFDEPLLELGRRLVLLPTPKRGRYRPITTTGAPAGKNRGARPNAPKLV